MFFTSKKNILQTFLFIYPLPPHPRHPPPPSPQRRGSPCAHVLLQVLTDVLAQLLARSAQDFPVHLTKSDL